MVWSAKTSLVDVEHQRFFRRSQLFVFLWFVSVSLDQFRLLSSRTPGEPVNPNIIHNPSVKHGGWMCWGAGPFKVHQVFYHVIMTNDCITIYFVIYKKYERD